MIAIGKNDTNICFVALLVYIVVGVKFICYDSSFLVLTNPFQYIFRLLILNFHRSLNTCILMLQHYMNKRHYFHITCLRRKYLCKNDKNDYRSLSSKTLRSWMKFIRKHKIFYFYQKFYQTKDIFDYSLRFEFW